MQSELGEEKNNLIYYANSSLNKKTRYFTIFATISSFYYILLFSCLKLYILKLGALFFSKVKSYLAYNNLKEVSQQ